MQENNLLDRNSTNDIQGVKLTYALVILISSIETENQLSYCGGTIQSVSWSLAEFRHNKIVQSPHENYFKYVDNTKKSEIS